MESTITTKGHPIRSVCVYCASSTKIPAIYFEVANELGRLLGEKGLNVVNGAGNIGLMRAVSDATLTAGGTVTGIIPHFMVEQDWYHKGLTQLIEVETMHERKQQMANLSDACIALPGGCGTLEELLEVITWKQLGLYVNPIVILNVNHYYDPLLQLFEKAIQEQFMRPQHQRLWAVAKTAEEAVQLIHNEPLWDPSLRKIAAI
ncbi:MAG: TIGR00730 family Rossman fold protein [Parabacteroides sp.]